MTVVELLLLLVIAALAGALGQALAGFELGGCLISILLGFVGAYLGMWLARELDLPTLLVVEVGDEPFPFIWSIIGSAIVALVLGLLTSRRPVRT
jgi:uncharacterized membrane protein YeaQ/YmgE (transglycosylase-associated protein family)